ncbi:Glycerol dehydrogenase Gld1 [Schizosaccharomyces pombe]|uniref:Glycerol dehydrogenase 1 n=1 Tax=Schizosaccharomyces pombe (strain 972 / ATCC 24843) TaxID=284812 RepID=GLD1_SCHPO|nr:glycerol dehydrogenase Gld1 [Schizosaccharomyces pombe]O13702.1 RecName: Full=Glycerol dehydrogenase 1; Short=GDH; Short=GLDH [Schizosaccharomyces pombe 972h-]1TA9_A Chain A, glycerol dehydrogenase [Schizosaccharomyces pombe]1TA9_B Chain B, glycerol dehydrogenase [Schizosaccharomyces pombe]CAB11766.1 mitochondrial glycerol dehydrogenase Gld1 [Schizosaccharomyces pombe]|eukprot:NP_593651.1 glycerol dehydrogenase Gld1 [Schizosaccharomyces pombe]
MIGPRLCAATPRFPLVSLAHRNSKVFALASSNAVAQRWGKRFYAPIETETPHKVGVEFEESKDRIFTSPQKYVQGRHAFTRSYMYVKKWATKSAVVLADQNVWNICANKIVDSLSQNGMTVTKLVFGGEASLVELDKLRKQCPDDTQVIIGVGGGKTMDSAKYIAHSMNLPSIICPTTASSDAATSSLSVIYTPDGQFQKYSFYPLNPNLIFIDTDVIVRAPVRFLISGIGDALSTWVETESVIRSNSTSFAGGVASIAGRYIARACKDTLEKYALSAILSNTRGVCTEAFENVVEANTLMSGLGFENGGLAAAHAIHNGMTAIHGPVHRLMHGEKVAYGTLVQVVLEDWPLEDFNNLASFMAKCHLPITLEELGIPNVTDEELLMVGRATLRPDESIHNMSKKFNPSQIADAIKAVDSYSQKWQEQTGWTERFRLPPSRHSPHLTDIHP